MLVFVAGCLAVLALVIAVLRRQVLFAIGIGVGLALAGITAALAPAFSLGTMPVWLPALPFALVAFTLLFFGVLAWWWGSDR